MFQLHAHKHPKNREKINIRTIKLSILLASFQENEGTRRPMICWTDFNPADERRICIPSPPGELRSQQGILLMGNERVVLLSFVFFHLAAPFKNSPFIDDEARRQEISVEFSLRMDLDP